MRLTKPRPAPRAIDVSMRAQAPQGQSLRIDLWIARRLGKPDLYHGTTVGATRMARQRAEIIRQGIADARVLGASTETWGEMFERVHGEPL